MNYMNYETAIVEKYKVELVGWPPHIPFANPSTLGTMDAVRSLRSALQVGECKWVAQTLRQQAAHADKLKALRESGQIIGKKRKERSDKGKKRAHAGEQGGGQQEKTKRRAILRSNKSSSSSQVPPAPKSRAFIDDEDDDDEDE
jgi:hypothetical protein